MDIYYIEDDRSVAQLTAQYLKQRSCIVHTYETIQETKEALKDHVPELILLDRSLPDGDGNDFCRWLRTSLADIPIIFLTVKNDTHDIVSGFSNGADDYVTKPFELPVLYSRICAVLRRSGNLQNDTLSCGAIVLNKTRMVVLCENKEISVSQAEYQLLLILLENKGKTVTRQRLLEQIWDSSGNYVNDNTLTVTMKRLREKLGQPASLKTIRSFGYRMEEIL